jgi:hypothetical protein
VRNRISVVLIVCEREREGGRERIRLVACNLPFFLDFICYKILSTDDEWLQCLRAKKHNNVVISTQKQYYSINQCMVTAITVNYSY